MTRSELIRQRLGTTTDRAIATDFGVSEQYVSHMRRKAGIPTYIGPRNPLPTAPSPLYVMPEHLAKRLIAAAEHKTITPDELIGRLLDIAGA